MFLSYTFRWNVYDEAVCKLLESCEKDVGKYMLYINDMSCVKFHLYGMKTILDIAQIYNNYEVFEILTQKYNSTGELTKKNPHQHQKMSMIRSLVDSSIYEGDYDFLEICLKYVIDIHELNDRGESYLETAVEYSDPNGIMVEAIKIILQKMKK